MGKDDKHEAKYKFYKNNIFTSLKTILFLTLENIEDKELQLIILLTRVSELILSYEYDVFLGKQKNPNRASHWENVNNFFINGDNYSKKLKKAIEKLGEITKEYRNSAQHHYVITKPMSNVIKDSYDILFDIMSSNISKNTVSKIFSENKQIHLEYCILYCKIKDITCILDKLMFKYKDVFSFDYYEKNRCTKRYLFNMLSGSIFNRHYLALEYINPEITNELLKEIKDYMINSKNYDINKLFLDNI